MSLQDSAIAILQHSNDGNRLAPRDLKLLELAVNGRLNEAGEVAFAELHTDVMSGEYFTTKRRWLYGVEHLTQDHEGYVYWKDIRVDHYSFRDADEGRAAALQLEQRCLMLEARGFPVNGRTVDARDCYEAEAGTPWMYALTRYYSFLEKDGVVTGIFYRTHQGEGLPEVVCVSQSGGIAELHFDSSAYAAYHRLQDAGHESMSVWATFEESVSRLERLGVTPEWLDEVIRSKEV
jgi:hypothetical protein